MQRPSATEPRPKVRRTRADGQRTREAILQGAVSLATVDGLEGLTIGSLATAIGMSKSGLYAHFGAKQELQLATVAAAERIFEDEVVAPAFAVEAGLPQLLTVTDSFCGHLARRTFPGGCFFTAAAFEMGPHPGPVRDAVAEFQRSFVGVIRGFAAAAIERGQLPRGEDPVLVAFELHGMMLAAHTDFVLQDDPTALDLARRAVRRRLGVIAA